MSVALTSALAFSRTSVATALSFDAALWRGVVPRCKFESQHCQFVTKGLTTSDVGSDCYCYWPVSLALFVLLNCSRQNCPEHFWIERLLIMQERTQSKQWQNQHVPPHHVELPWRQPLPSAGLLLLWGDLRMLQGEGELCHTASSSHNTVSLWLEVWPPQMLDLVATAVDLCPWHYLYC